MKKNQKGFSAVEALLIFVTLGVIGFVGWYVWQTKNKDSKPGNTQTSTAVPQNAEPETTKPADDTANWKSYTRYGITFKYPTEWSFKANDSTQSTSTTLTSPDFSVTVGDFSDETTKGERITVDEAGFAESGLTADNFKTKHLDPNPNKYSDYELLTVNSKKAVQFYRGDSRTTVFFLANDKTVTFVLDTFPNRAASSSVYNKIIETITYD